MTPSPLEARRGPRPLLLHLMLAAWARAGAVMPPRCMPDWPPGSSSLNSAWPFSKPGRREAARIGAALAAANQPPEAFAAAVERALRQDDAALCAGILRYREHPYRRDLPDPPVVWAEGGSRLLDYGGAGPAVLFVPSLVNRAHILDLLPGGSMLRFLAAAGARPLLLDWGVPGEAERGFTLTDYVAGRLERGLAAAARASGGPVVLAGFCMGGLLGLAAAQRRPDLVRALALLATPWDFAAGDAGRARAAPLLLPVLAPLMAARGVLPVDVLQALFALLDPFGVSAKYRAFGRTDPASPRGIRFVALEDWLNDGVPLAASVARECIADWYGGNAPARGAWRIAGEVVDPAATGLPAFVAVPARDRIVPPASALALAQRLPGALVHHAAAGHVGMVAGGNAERVLWRPLLGWLQGLPEPARL